MTGEIRRLTVVAVVGDNPDCVIATADLDADTHTWSWDCDLCGDHAFALDSDIEAAADLFNHLTDFDVDEASV